MKKLLVLLMLAITVFSGCAPKTIAQSERNDEILKKLEEDGETELTYVGEYSFLSEPGQITGTYDLAGNKAVVFTSLGRPSIIDNTKNEIFAGSDEYRIYLKIKTDGGDEYIETRYPGMVFKKASDDFSVSEFKDVDCILDINDEMGGNEIDKFEWLDNVFQKHGHNFGIFMERGSFERVTVFGNEKVTLTGGLCSGFQYRDGWIYYIDKDSLFKVKEDGSETVQVYDKDIIDYTLEDSRILILKYVNSDISVCSLPYAGGEAQQITSVGSYDTTRFNKIIGSIGDTFYLCSRGAADTFEITSVKGNSVDSVYYTTENPSGLKPFLHNNCIYFVTRLFKNNLKKFDISTGKDSVIAEGLYYSGQTLVE